MTGRRPRRRPPARRYAVSGLARARKRLRVHSPETASRAEGWEIRHTVSRACILHRPPGVLYGAFAIAINREAGCPLGNSAASHAMLKFATTINRCSSASPTVISACTV